MIITLFRETPRVQNQILDKFIHLRLIGVEYQSSAFETYKKGLIESVIVYI